METKIFYVNCRLADYFGRFMNSTQDESHCRFLKSVSAVVKLWWLHVLHGDDLPFGITPATQFLKLGQRQASMHEPGSYAGEH